MGYTGGTNPDPTYLSISDHTEALRVEFDPTQLSLEDIYRMFWKEHSPMPLSLSGTQYRSAIFYHTQEQKDAATAVLEHLLGSSPFYNKCEYTALEEANDFYRAEEYHQQFLMKQRRGVDWIPSI